MDASVSLTRRRLHLDPKSATRARIHSSGTLSPSKLWTWTMDTADTACWRREDRLSAHGGRARGTDSAFRNRWESRSGCWLGRDRRSQCGPCLPPKGEGAWDAILAPSGPAAPSRESIRIRPSWPGRPRSRFRGACDEVAARAAAGEMQSAPQKNRSPCPAPTAPVCGPGPERPEVEASDIRASSERQKFCIAHRHVAARPTPALEPAAQNVLHKRTSVDAFRERKQVELTT